MSTDRDELDRLAGEYVLGLLETSDRSAFEAALTSDASARDALRHARERFLELDALAPVAETSPELWARIEGALDRGETPAPDRSNVHALPVKPPSRFWHGFAAASAAAVIIALVGMVSFRTLIVSQQPQLVVVLLNEQSQPEAIVEAYASREVRVVPLEVIDVPDGKTLEVWTLPDPETGPVSLGLMEDPGAVLLSDRGLPAPRADQLYEITIEDAGGSPTGRPTGPIVAKGFARVPQL